MRWLKAVVLFLTPGILITILWSARAQQANNPVEIENALPGTSAWQGSNWAANHEIEGYASRTSVNRGEPISFFVSTTDPSYTLEIFRMGWYGGLGARRMTDPVTLPGVQQTVPAPDPTTGLVDCNWNNPYTVVTNDPSDPSKWLSGTYLVKLTGTVSGKQQYIFFVVRDDNRASDLLYQVATTTYEAYNNYGGKSLYAYNSIGPQAVKVSFNRPYLDGRGSGNFLNFDLDMVAFLEQQGYDVSYSTSVDTHRNGPNLLLHRVLLFIGHDEYWSYEMRTNVATARNLGASLGFFSANDCYWQIRFEQSPATGDANRVIVAYKETWQQDPATQDPSTYYLVTTRWRDPHVTLPGNPEDGLIGEMYNEFEPVN